ncbi:MAG: hypothetical protein ACOCRX_04705 [Candidatus Woesearchaeota archaeon]
MGPSKEDLECMVKSDSDSKKELNYLCSIINIENQFGVDLFDLKLLYSYSLIKNENIEWFDDLDINETPFDLSEYLLNQNKYESENRNLDSLVFNLLNFDKERYRKGSQDKLVVYSYSKFNFPVLKIHCFDYEKRNKNFFFKENVYGLSKSYLFKSIDNLLFPTEYFIQDGNNVYKSSLKYKKAFFEDFRPQKYIRNLILNENGI